MDYLNSNMGKRHIQHIIDDINEERWPQRDSVESAWNRKRPTAGYNKSLVGDHVSQEYRRKLSVLHPDKEIIFTFQMNDLLKEDIQSYRVMISDSRFAEKIIFIKENNGKEFVAKVFRNLSFFKEEETSLSSQDKYVKLIAELETKHNKKLPSLMEYKGTTTVNEKGIILLTKANGKTLKKISEEINEIADEKIAKIFNNVGNQLGELDALCYLHNNKNLIAHPDSHGGNLIYDEDEDQLHLIDTAGLKDEKQYLTLKRMDFLCDLYPFFSGAELSGYPAPCKKWLEKDAQDFYIEAKKKILAYNSLYEGYAHALIENGLSYIHLFEEGPQSFRPSMPKRYIANINDQFVKFDLPPIDFEKEYKIQRLNL